MKYPFLVIFTAGVRITREGNILYLEMSVCSLLGGVPGLRFLGGGPMSRIFGRGPMSSDFWEGSQVSDFWGGSRS